MKIKKFTILSILIIFTLSCSNELLQNDNIENTKQTNKYKSGGDGKFDILGHGFDITKVNNSTSSREQILDIEKLKTIPNEITLNDNMSLRDFYLISGENELDYSNNLKYSDNATFKILGVEADLSRSFGLQSRYTSKYSYSSISANYIKRSYKIHSDVEILKSYLTDYFKDAINNKDFEYLINHYGTHVLTGIYLGAKLNMNYQTEITSTESKSQIALHGSIKAFEPITAKMGQNLEYDASLVSKNTNTNTNINSTGGKFSFDTNNPTNSVISSWLNSLDDIDVVPIFIGVKDEGIIPIYEFVSDPVRKENLRNYIENIYIPASNFKNTPSNQIDATRFLDTFSNNNQGGGVAIGDIDNNGVKDLVFMVIDNPDGTNNLRFRYLFDIDQYGNTNKSPIYFKTEGYGNNNFGGGVGIADIDKNGKMDVIVTIQDNNSSAGNQFYYKVLFNVNSLGQPQSTTNFINLGSLTSANCDGANMCITDINNNGIADLVYMTYEDKDKNSNYFIYKVAFDLQPNGLYKSQSMNSFRLLGLGNDGEGCAITAGDIDKNNKTDLVLTAIDAPDNANNIRYKIIKNIDQTGMSYDVSGTIYGRYIGDKNSGAGAILHDFDLDNNLDILLMPIDSPTGTNMYWYNIYYLFDINGKYLFKY